MFCFSDIVIADNLERVIVKEAPGTKDRQADSHDFAAFHDVWPDFQTDFSRVYSRDLTQVIMVYARD